MDKDNRLADEQLAGVSGGASAEYSITLDGVTMVLGGPETYLAFSEMERKGGTRSWSYYDAPLDYYTWYYNHYGEPHPGDYR